MERRVGATAGCAHVCARVGKRESSILTELFKLMTLGVSWVWRLEVRGGSAGLPGLRRGILLILASI